MRRILEAALCASPLAAGCGQADVPGTHTEVLVVAPHSAGPLFTRTDPRRSVAHGGLRRIECTRVSGLGSSYRERITTDGHGRYSIHPVDSPVEASISEWEAFELEQRRREGFLFRYRDFLVRDPRLFERNWTTTNLGLTLVVAGRTCERYRVERTAGEPIAFELSVDAATGLVLASEEYDERGQLIAAMTYESFELDPDLAAVVWHVPGEELVLDPLVSLEPQLDARPLQPRLLPSGYYGPLEAATVRDGRGVRWLKLTYSDGVEPLFFLHALSALSNEPRRAWKDGVEPLFFPHALAEPSQGKAAPSTVVVFRVGAAIVIQGTVDGFDLVVIGKVSEAELLDMIESCLPD